MKNFKLAVCQMMTGKDKDKNIEKAINMINEAADNGAELVVLPEIFNSPYDTSCFEKYSEKYPGKTSERLKEIAKKRAVYVLGGSIPEESEGKIYNTAYFFDDRGEMIARHRKMHLFDIDVVGGQYFKESDVLSPGDDFTVADTKFGKIGIGICFDVRFPEYFRVLAKKGAELILLPASFNMTTGPLHWEISLRMRAIDNQVYLVGASPARNMNSSYISYANSRVVDPWGRVVSQADEKECIIYADIDSKLIDSFREEIPILKSLRDDRYEVVEK